MVDAAGASDRKETVQVASMLTHPSTMKLSPTTAELCQATVSEDVPVLPFPVSDRTPDVRPYGLACAEVDKVPPLVTLRPLVDTPSL